VPSEFDPSQIPKTTSTWSSMMWPFSKSRQELNDLPPISSDAHVWSIAEATYDDAPLIVRFNSGAKAWQGCKSLPIKLAFAVPLNTPNVGGLPDPEENRVLSDVEAAILHEVEAASKGILVLVLTMGTMKEFVFYVPAGVDIGAIHEAIRRRVSTHDVQCIGVEDPAWEAYTQFTDV